MSPDRDALVRAFRDQTGCTDTEADRAVRDVELACAEKQNAELRKQVETLSRMLEKFPDLHMRFDHFENGTLVKATGCADWCYACQIDKLRTDVNEWQGHENRARSAAMALAQLHGHTAPVLARILAGHYEGALTLASEQLGTSAE